mmetsp:Transcript_9519/g.14575  ORF Transcript_9519/g.14575 Transcript_9519/m.14575 type:complete len:187 (-) Transcript_9519:63-623(-)
MQGLYKKILKGELPRIPEHFSSDIWAILRLMLHVNPKKRPDCDQLMEHPVFRRRSHKYFPDVIDYDRGESRLLQTIQFPKNIMLLTRRLPKKNYDTAFDGGHMAQKRKSIRNPISSPTRKSEANPKAASSVPSSPNNNKLIINIGSLEQAEPTRHDLKLPQINAESPGSLSTNDRSKLVPSSLGER